MTQLKFVHYSLVALAVLTCSGSIAHASQEQYARDLARAAATELAKEMGSQDTAVYQEAARSYFDWGVIIRPDGTILSVRDGSVAEVMGVQVGDDLQQVDELQLNNANLAELLEYVQGLAHDSEFQATVERNGERLRLTGQAQTTVVPGWRLEIELPRDEQVKAVAGSTECGRISVFNRPSIRDHHPALINSIDGERYTSLNPTVILSAGEHRIGVHELIADPSLRRSRGLDREKPLTLLIEPNKKYHLAAHYIREKRYDRVEQGYWQPVVWKVTEQNCRLD